MQDDNENGRGSAVASTRAEAIEKKQQEVRVLKAEIGKAKWFQITGKVVLGFLTAQDQYDRIIDSGVLESNGSTIWYVDTKGRREKSITIARAVDVWIAEGLLKEIVRADGGELAHQGSS